MHKIIKRTHTSFSRLLLSTSLLIGSLSYVPVAHAAPLYFYPAQTWETQTSNSTCQVSNLYNNGFIVTLKGAHTAAMKQTRALTVNFRQAAFTVGQTYHASLTLPNAPSTLLPATASNAESLTLSFQQDPQLLNDILTSPTFNLLVEGNDFHFSLVGLSRTAQQFETCLNTVHQQTPAAPPPPRPIPAAAAPPPQAPTQLIKSRPSILSSHKPAAGTPTWNTDKLYAEIRRQTKTAPPKAAVPKAADPQHLIHTPAAKPTAIKPAPIAAPAPPEPLVPAQNTTPQNTVSKPILNSKDWSLEKATMRFQEAERQLKSIGTKLQKERAICKMEKKELEALLFDPHLTTEQQLAKLSSLEDELARTKLDMHNQELRYKERIKILEDQLDAF